MSYETLIFHFMCSLLLLFFFRGASSPGGGGSIGPMSSSIYIKYASKEKINTRKKTPNYQILHLQHYYLQEVFCYYHSCLNLQASFYFYKQYKKRNQLFFLRALMLTHSKTYSHNYSPYYWKTVNKARLYIKHPYQMFLFDHIWKIQKRIQ